VGIIIQGNVTLKLPVLTIINKQKKSLRNEGQEGKTSPVWGLVQGVSM
jgi:hypothetical protein